MDKLDDFLKNRLNDRSLTESSSEDGWNVPSDDLWNAAKIHFPKKEKKNRWYFWLPILLLLFGSLGTGYYFGKMSSEKKSEHKNEIVESSNSDLQEKFINNKIAPKNEIDTDVNSAINNVQQDNSIAESVDEILNVNISSKNEKSIAPTITNLSKEEEASNKIILNKKDLSSKKTIDKSNIIDEGQNASKEINTTFPSEKTIQYKREEIQDNSKINQTNFKEPIDDLKYEKDEKFLAQNANRLNSSSLQDDLFVKSEVKNNKPISLNNNNNPSLGEFTSLNSKTPTNLEQLILLDKIIPKPISNFEMPTNKFNRKIRPNKEIGISSTSILLQPLSKINFNSDDEDSDSLNIDLKYLNGNFHYTKWFAKRWSFSTGLYLSKFDIKINASISDTLGTDGLDLFVSNEFNDAIDIKVADTRNDFQIQLLEGAQVAESDLLEIDAKVDLILHSAQIPLLLNYHISKKRMEYLFTIGGSLDFYSARINDLDLQIYKNGTLINEPISQSSIKGKFVFGSIYTQTSFRYKFNRRLSLGLTAKINFINPFISGLETGLYYRFY